MAIDMAINMMTVKAVTTKIIATSLHETSANSPFGHETSALTTPTVAAQAHPECGEHAVDGAALTAGASEPYRADMTGGEHNDHCKPCQACQACHTVALSPSVARSMALCSFQDQPDNAAFAFVNADAALSKKPPIS